MYYLLDDNNIIDSEKLETIKFPKSNVVTFKRYDDFFCSTNKIKKQRENVYDLIDWEKDLVKVDDAIHHCKYFHRDLREEYIKYKWFNAIYKPNSNGDFIKVWEEVKKDEKNENPIC